VVTVNDQPTVSATSTNETCGLLNGTAIAIPTSCSQYNYSWSNGQTSIIATGLPAGTYTVTVTCTPGGCSATATTTLTNIPAPTVSITNIINSTCEQSNGSAESVAIGGTPPYSYLWNTTPIQTNPIMINVSAGTYNVSVTDSYGCITTNSIVITTTVVPTATTTFVNETCNRSDGSVTVIPNGGTGNYTYSWSTNPTQTGVTAINLTAGNYSVTVNDGNCTVITNAIVQNIPGPTAEMSINPDIVYGVENPVSFISNSGINIISYNWNFGDGNSGTGNSNIHTYPALGTYYVTLIVIDINGCTDTITDSVQIKDIFAFFIPNAFTPNGNGINDLWFPSGNFYDPNNYDCSIFDRWGKLIFHTNNINEHWNGTLNNNGDVDHLVMDVYVYKIVVKESGNTRKHEFLGRITLIP
jgi:gliding motility-associated-like protein